MSAAVKSRAEAAPAQQFDAPIDQFSGGDSFFLSNSWPGRLAVDGTEYPTAEHAFQAGKASKITDRQQIATAGTPGEAWRLGQTVPLPPGWSDKGRHQMMWQVAAAKFKDPAMAGRLEATGAALLIAGGLHHDRYWGDCRCPEHRESVGGNELGRMLMAIRSLRRGDPADTWTRVAVVGHGSPTAAQHDWTAGQLARVVGKLQRHHGTSAVLTAAVNPVDLDAAEQAQHKGVPTWVYLPAPDYSQQLPRAVVYRHEQVRARSARIDAVALNPINGRPGRAADLAGKVITWLLRDADALISIGDRGAAHSRAATAATAAKTAALPVISIDPTQQRVTIATN